MRYNKYLCHIDPKTDRNFIIWDHIQITLFCAPGSKYIAHCAGFNKAWKFVCHFIIIKTKLTCHMSMDFDIQYLLCDAAYKTPVLSLYPCTISKRGAPTEQNLAMGRNNVPYNLNSGLHYKPPIPQDIPTMNQLPCICFDQPPVWCFNLGT